jgi:hypothetical protein
MRRRRLLLIVPLALAVAASAGRTQSRPITLLVPAFEGPQSLGVNVATILNLQVWQTLRKAPYPNPGKLNFGNGMVTWSAEPLAPQTHEAAAAAAKASAADLVMWGKAHRYGTGVVVQSYLTIVPRPEPLWRTALPSGGADATLEAMLPRLRYEFRSIVLDDGIVQQYSTPEALRLYKTREGGDPIGTVGAYFIAREQAGNAAFVESGADKGWIRLPALSRNRSEIVDFVGGIVRILRADWGGADALFAKVLANPNTPTAVKVDAHLYRAVALERTGAAGLDQARRAYALNPYDRSTIAYLVMCQMATAGRMPPGSANRNAMLADARRLLDTNKFLFPPADPWVTRAAAVIAGR